MTFATMNRHEKQVTITIAMSHLQISTDFNCDYDLNWCTSTLWTISAIFSTKLVFVSLSTQYVKVPRIFCSRIFVFRILMIHVTHVLKLVSIMYPVKGEIWWAGTDTLKQSHCTTGLFLYRKLCSRTMPESFSKNTLFLLWKFLRCFLI